MTVDEAHWRIVRDDGLDCWVEVRLPSGKWEVVCLAGTRDVAESIIERLSGADWKARAEKAEALLRELLNEADLAAAQFNDEHGTRNKSHWDTCAHRIRQHLEALDR